MSFQPRPYQADAINAGIDFFKGNDNQHALEVLPTGSGKSVVIANIAMGLEGKSLILQPSKEILQQNFAKFTSYGYRAGIYSASAGMKYLDDITFATIGSIAQKHHLFKGVKKILIDECHCVAPDSGMYHDFIKNREREGAKVLGFTATPYRLTSEDGGAMLKFLTRTRPRIFNEVLYYIQNGELFDNGFLAPLEYFSFDVIDRNRLQMNAAGTDFTPESLKEYYKQIDMVKLTINYANKILKQRNNLLVFCSLISEAQQVARGIPGAVVITGDTDPATRDKILSQFKAGVIRCVINVGVLTTGFDYPELEAVLISRSTMSLALYYQIIGRVMRPYTYPDGSKKTGWVVDLGGNINFFGKIETMIIEEDQYGHHFISNNGRQLTNIIFSKN